MIWGKLFILPRFCETTPKFGFNCVKASLDWGNFWFPVCLLLFGTCVSLSLYCKMCCMLFRSAGRERHLQECSSRSADQHQQSPNTPQESHFWRFCRRLVQLCFHSKLHVHSSFYLILYLLLMLTSSFLSLQALKSQTTPQPLWRVTRSSTIALEACSWPRGSTWPWKVASCLAQEPWATLSAFSIYSPVPFLYLFSVR